MTYGGSAYYGVQVEHLMHLLLQLPHTPWSASQTTLLSQHDNFWDVWSDRTELLLAGLPAAKRAKHYSRHPHRQPSGWLDNGHAAAGAAPGGSGRPPKRRASPGTSGSEDAADARATSSPPRGVDPTYNPSLNPEPASAQKRSAPGADAAAGAKGRARGGVGLGSGRGGGLAPGSGRGGRSGTDKRKGGGGGGGGAASAATAAAAARALALAEPQTEREAMVAAQVSQSLWLLLLKSWRIARL